VPEWAKPAAVLQALKAQQHIDPDRIFAKSSKQDTCDLTDMFKGAWRCSSSSLVPELSQIVDPAWVAVFVVREPVNMCCVAWQQHYAAASVFIRVVCDTVDVHSRRHVAAL
jgi:hypothetical protein